MLALRNGRAVAHGPSTVRPVIAVQRGRWRDRQKVTVGPVVCLLRRYVAAVVAHLAVGEVAGKAEVESRRPIAIAVRSVVQRRLREGTGVRGRGERKSRAQLIRVWLIRVRLIRVRLIRGRPSEVLGRRCSIWGLYHFSRAQAEESFNIKLLLKLRVQGIAGVL